MAQTNNGRGPVGRLAQAPVDLLVCFAVKEEAKYFALAAERFRILSNGLSSQAWITGMGRSNAADGIRRAIKLLRPERVITAGFAGGLNPKYKLGTVLYDQDFLAGFGPELEDLGAISGRFYCHKRVAITVGEKAELWRSSGADAVEMESAVIRTICNELSIPSATVRVISDDATQDLPLDFNALMTSDDRIDYMRLIWSVMSRPTRIPKLIDFQRQTIEAARKLGVVLEGLLRAERNR